MSYWDDTTGTIIHFAPEPWPDYPAWERVDCGCSCGLEWGGEEPRECNMCGGNGYYARHIKSGTIALYPGGPLLGAHERGQG